MKDLMHVIHQKTRRGLIHATRNIGKLGLSSLEKTFTT